MKKININIGLIATIIVIIFVIIANVYSFQKVSVLKNDYNNFKNIQSVVEQNFNKSETGLTEYKNNQKVAELKNKESVKNVIPSAEEITSLNRQLEKYFNSLNSSSNPIFLQNINYGQAIENTEQAGLFTIPISLSFNGADKNFYKTIDYLTSSGDLQRETRLIEITKINVNWKGQTLEDSGIEVFDFEIEGLAYFYKAI